MPGKRKRSVGRSSYKSRRSHMAKSGRKKRRFGSLRGPKKSTTSVSIARNIGPADRQYVKLKYSQFINLTSTAGVVNDNVWRGSSLFDPDLTGTGTQPYYFDQWAALYNFYSVLGSSIKVTCALGNVSSVAAGTCDLVVIPTQSTGTFVGSTQDVVLQQPYAKHRVIALQQITEPGVITHYMSTDKMYGSRNGTTDMVDTSYGAAVSANPNSTWAWHVCMWPHDRASTVTNYIQVEITYYCIFTGLVRPAAS